MGERYLHLFFFKYESGCVVGVGVGSYLTRNAGLQNTEPNSYVDVFYTPSEIYWCSAI